MERRGGHGPLSDLAVSRRRFLQATGAATGALVLPGALTTSVLAAENVATVFPRPIPGGVTPFGILVHHFPPVPLLGPGPINEPSEITDFNGLVGQTRVTGSGTGTDLTTGATKRLSFQVDNGFMSGLYIGEDGRKHHGTFAFV